MGTRVTIEFEHLLSDEKLSALAAALDDENTGAHQSTYTQADALTTIINASSTVAPFIQDGIGYWVSHVEGEYMGCPPQGDWIDADDWAISVANRRALIAQARLD